MWWEQSKECHAKCEFTFSKETALFSATSSLQLPNAEHETEKGKEKFALCSDHDESLPRRQPGAEDETTVVSSV